MGKSNSTPNETADQATRDEKYLRQALVIAKKARDAGNHPFGALLVDMETDTIVAVAENTVNTDKDCTGHAETNLMRKASPCCTVDVLRRSTLYTSTEPCCMCAGAMHWGQVGRVVYALAEDTLYQKIGGHHVDNETLQLPCRTVFAASERKVEVVGPMMEEEAWQVHEGFW